MIQRLLDSYDVSKLPTKYDLIANIVHTGAPQGGSYKAQIYCRAKDQWYEMENLHVTETMPQLVAVSEAYVQIYELQQ
jgi:U4/U6.U5 tri-snRNP-associated protein 2